MVDPMTVKTASSMPGSGVKITPQVEPDSGGTFLATFVTGPTLHFQRTAPFTYSCWVKTEECLGAVSHWSGAIPAVMPLAMPLPKITTVSMVTFRLTNASISVTENDPVVS